MKLIPVNSIRIASLAGAALLAACGGGGGGSSSDSNASATATISSSNALEITREVYATTGLEDGFAASLGDGFISASSLTVAGQAGILNLAGRVARTVAPDIFPAPAVSASAAQTIFCDFGGSIEINANDDGSRVTAVFNSCQGLGGDPLLTDAVIDGRIEISINSNLNDVDHIDITVGFSGFSISMPQGLASLEGNYREIYDDLTNPDEYSHERLRVIVDNLQVQLDSQRRGLSGYDFQEEEQFPLSGGGIEQLDFRGTLNIPKFGGTVIFNTVVPFVYDYNVYGNDNGGLTPQVAGYTQGVLRIEGADGTLIRIAVIEGTEDISVRVDTDGDGEFDWQPDWSWDQIENYNSIY